MARGSSLKSPGRRVFMIFLVQCIVSLSYDVFVLFPILRDIFYIFYDPMARYSLFVLKVPLNTK